MKKLLYILLVFISSNIVAQQTPIYSLYMLNNFSINPAVTGTEDFFKAQVNRRHQYAGIKDAPRTLSLTAQGDLEKLSMGLGGLVFNDTHGAFSKFGVYAAYSYRVRIDKHTNISFGVNVGVISYNIDLTKTTTLQEELNLNTDNYGFVRPDATVGVYLYAKNYYVGISADQLFNNNLEFEKDPTTDKEKLNRVNSHFSLIGGYNYELSYGFEFKPSLVVRTGINSPLQVEATARLDYNKMVWAGVSLRTNDAVSILLGYTYQDMIYLGYSYDITYSGLRKDSGGSHEIVLGIKFHESFK